MLGPYKRTAHEVIPVGPWQPLDSAPMPGGGELVLYHRDGEYMIRCNGWELMSSRAHGSEEALAEQACGRLAKASPSVLVGGLGMGYTLASALKALPSGARVTVAELLPAVVAWNRGPLGHLAGWPLRDLRVVAVVADVGEMLRAAVREYDAVLLDVDNGPLALSLHDNEALYGATGLAAAREALRPDGVLAVWSAGPDPAFADRLTRAGFIVESHEVPARGTVGDPRHTIYLGKL